MSEKIADEAVVWKSSEDGLWYVHTQSSENNAVVLTSEGYENHDHAMRVAYDTGLTVVERDREDADAPA
jgi:hypothetical protein